jgi:RNA-directed DNA polymerase
MEKATKVFSIEKSLVVQAWKLVKANKGSGGIDDQSIANFEVNLKDNLYKIWNRMSSGSYFPPAVKAVPIPKKSGGTRILGIPTVGDRVAQTVVKLVFEPVVEKIFLPDSYGYRPHKSAIDAVRITRERCWKFDWVVEFDVKGLFDNIDHELLMKAVVKHTDNKWILLYIQRWLVASMELKDGEIIQRTKGTPQGSVIGPVLANLFLHYVFDYWMNKHYPNNPWCRYADDGLAHCQSEREAEHLMKVLKERFLECKLELHPDKTKIIYCKSSKKTKEYPITSFDFLSFTFRPRCSRNKRNGELFAGFLPAISKGAKKAINAKIRKTNLRNRSELSLKEIAKKCNPVLRGVYNYYGKFYPSAMNSIWDNFDRTLTNWAMNKYKKFKHRKPWASKFIQRIAAKDPKLFVHWEIRNKMAMV